MSRRIDHLLAPFRLAPFRLAPFRLARWLGPWADEARRPAVTPVRRRVAGPRPFELALYVPERPRHAWLLIPGLHYAGPDDPRLDRFCRILAHSGAVVVAPFLPDYTALRIAPGVLSDSRAALDAACALPELAGLDLSVFSISFGSLPALALASDPRVRALVCFGGFVDFTDAARFCVTGQLNGRQHTHHDPLNRPVVFANLLDELPADPTHHAALWRAWRTFCERTWGRPECRPRAARASAAAGIEQDVPAPVRHLFRQGCGLEPGGEALVDAALAKRGAIAWLDPQPHLERIRCPVRLFHGVDDDVIPFTHSERLAAAFPPHADVSVHLTGLFGHTGAGASGHGPMALAGELVTMWRMLNVLADPR